MRQFLPHGKLGLRPLSAAVARPKADPQHGDQEQVEDERRNRHDDQDLGLRRRELHCFAPAAVVQEQQQDQSAGQRVREQRARDEPSTRGFTLSSRPGE